MAKKNSHPVRITTVDPNFVGTISVREAERKVRKPLPPPTQRHKVKTEYRRQEKHPGQGLE
jgi:hypothetical protein